MQFWKSGVTHTLCADVFAASPLLSLCAQAPAVETEPRFIRAVITALRGKTLTRAHSRAGERIIEFSFASQSRFGVRSEYTLLFELVPRFGNILLLKDQTVLAALREFKTGKGGRVIQTGKPYTAPPAPKGPPRTLGTVQLSAGDVLSSELYVYRDSEDRVVQAYFSPLTQHSGLRYDRAPSLLDVLSESEPREDQVRASGRREEANAFLQSQERRALQQLERIDARLAECAKRDVLREQGAKIYASLHEIPPAERDQAKERAASLFAEYKKAARTVTELGRRRSATIASLEEIASLRWELERAGTEELADVLSAVEALRPQTKRRQAQKSRKRKPLEFAVGGARLLVGRSPQENAEITFRVARPNDLWFHVRGQPGAHVILQRNDNREPDAQQLEKAAELAAFHSKAKSSAKVTVDYTQRKHVRKRSGAAPGLVTYSHAKSVTVTPGDLTS